MFSRFQVPRPTTIPRTREGVESTLAVCIIVEYVSVMTVRTASMSKRVNVMLPDKTVAILERVAPRGRRSSFISQAVLEYVKTRTKRHLRERLKQEALADVERDIAMAEEWFPFEEQAWQKSAGIKSRKK